MSKNITYLIGAGASAEVIPVVSKLPEQMHAFAEQLGGTTPELQKFKKELQWLASETARVASIDTLAKQFSFQSDGQNLRRLKYLLTLYLYYLQVPQNIDKRYDQFIATLLSHTLELPPNINIVSWNYDSQFELAYNNYSQKNDILENQKSLRIINKGQEVIGDITGSAIYKLNGSAQFLKDKQFVPLDFFQKDINNSHFHKELGEKYQTLATDMNSLSALSFAWETEKFGSHFKRIIEGTEILVIIGYSFPDFNRQFDSFILSQMIRSLERVYIQDLPSMVAVIKRKVSEILGVVAKDVKILDTPTISSFYIPQDYFDDRNSPASDKIIEFW